MKHKLLKFSILVLILLGFIFTCKKLDLVKVAYLGEPVVSDTSYTSATVKAKIVDIGEGLTEHGFCWDTKAEPDIKSLNVTKKGPATAEKEYNSTITNLNPNTTYFVRAFAFNTKGDTIYGKQVQFTTRKTKVPTLTTTKPIEIKADSAKTGGNITNDGGSPIIEKGVCWGLTPNPDLTNHITSDGIETDSFLLTISGLKSETTYYVKAYATNTTGIAYGDEYSFKTLIPKTFPLVTTTEPYNIISTSATSGGEVTSDGGASITARGVCWNTSPNPTFDLSTKTNDGSGTGSFVSSITSLSSRTTYYVRAYAKNSAGISYGNQVSFKTTDAVIFNPNLTYGSVTDIDGNIYKTIQIGTQEWIAENLKTTHYCNGDPIPNGTVTGDYSSESTPKYYFNYDDKVANADVYGRLYTWFVLIDNRGVCPTAYHVPTDVEWTTLENTLGGSSVAGGKMKEIGTEHWASPNTGADNSSGFTGLPGSARFVDSGILGIGYEGYYWSATESVASKAWYHFLRFTKAIVGRYDGNKKYGFSARCMKDEGSQANNPTVSTNTISNITSTSATSGGNVTSDGGTAIISKGVCWSTFPNPTVDQSTKTDDGSGTGSYVSSITGLSAGTKYYVRAYATNSNGTNYGGEMCFTTEYDHTFGSVTDIESNVYKTIQIGTQVWMAENLKTTKYNDGTSISNETDNIAWTGLKTGAFCWYNNEIANKTTYGALYNWYTVTDSRNLCPAGWHVPSDGEWRTLIYYLGGEDVAGGKMKEIGITHWYSPNIGATNESGFKALPGGARESSNGTFNGLGYSGCWWSGTAFGAPDAWDCILSYDDFNVIPNGNYKGAGFSVRCVKD